MSYIDGFVVAVPTANKEVYRDFAQQAASAFRELGASRVVEAWGTDIPDGAVTDFKRAVAAKPDEAIVYAWIEYPDKETRNAVGERMMSDPRMQAMQGNMPFDGARMIYGGFGQLTEAGDRSKAGCMDGSLAAVPLASKAAFVTNAAKQAEIFLEYGALRVVDNWGDVIPDGKHTDFKMAVQATPDETVVFSWIEWPSSEFREQAWGKIMSDPRMMPTMHNSPFDLQRRVYGGFDVIIDT